MEEKAGETLPFSLAMNEIWKPHVVVAAIVERDGRYLLVEEHTDDGLRFNQPAGHLEPGESLLEAVCRETLEETARVFTPACLVGIYRFAPGPKGPTYLRFAFAGSVGEPDTARALDPDIVRADWHDLEQVIASAARHRSPLLMRCIEDYWTGHRFPLSILHELAP